MFIKRVVSTAMWCLIAYIAIYRLPIWGFRWVVTVLIGLGLFEFYTLSEKKGFRVGKFFSTSMGILVPLFVYPEHLTPEIRAAYPFFTVLFFLIFFGYQFAKGKNEGSLAGLSVTVAGVVYISVLFSFLIPLRIKAMHLVTYLLLVTKGGDIGAYLVGSLFGKTPFVPRVSPKKTFEGVMGAVGASVLISLFVARPLLQNAFIFYGGFGDLIIYAVMGFILGTVGVFGDLAESLIKRDCQAKDTQKFIPGMGGILDSIDSVLFTAPLFYAMVRLVH